MFASGFPILSITPSTQALGDTARLVAGGVEGSQAFKRQLAGARLRQALASAPFTETVPGAQRRYTQCASYSSKRSDRTQDALPIGQGPTTQSTPSGT